MKNVFIRSNNNNEKENNNHLINLDSFLVENDCDDNYNLKKYKSKKKKRGRPKKTKKMPDGNEIVTSSTNDNNDDNMLQYNIPYSSMYNNTNDMLKQSISQIDGLNYDIKSQIDKIKNSKTLKKKYDYLSNLTTSASNLISTKITAIREMNKSITDSNNLELKRTKDLKLNENEKDDDKTIMDMYNAFISTPVGNYNGANPLGLNTSQLTNKSNLNNIVKCNIDENMQPQSKNMTPIDHMMRLENNPNIQTVVIYDANTGNRWFDVIDITTNQSIPNVEKPDEMFLSDLTIDVKNGIARNNNLDLTYKLILTNNNLNEY